MTKEELMKLSEIVYAESKMCRENCCKNHLTIIQGYILKMMLDKDQGDKGDKK